MTGALPGSEIDPFFDYKNGAATSLNVDANKSFDEIRKECIWKWNTAARLFKKNLLLPKRKLRNGSYINSHQWASQYYSMPCP